MEDTKKTVEETVELLKDIADACNGDWSSIKIEKEETGEVLVMGWARSREDIPDGV